MKSYPLTLAFSFVAFASAARAERPNVVYIVADDLGYGELGCYGRKLAGATRFDHM